MNDGRVILGDQQSNEYNRFRERERKVLGENGKRARLYILEQESTSVLMAEEAE